MADSQTEKDVREKLLTAISETIDHKDGTNKRSAEDLLRLAEAYAIVTGRPVHRDQLAAFAEAWRSMASKATK